MTPQMPWGKALTSHMPINLDSNIILNIAQMHDEVVEAEKKIVYLILLNMS
jgi:hypothetical protein